MLRAGRCCACTCAARRPSATRRALLAELLGLPDWHWPGVAKLVFY